MKVELLYFEGCPNHEPTERLLREIISEMEINAEMIVVNVANDGDAIVKKFLGSPSIRINGKDLEIEEKASTQYSMSCRMYRSEKGLSAGPPMQLIRDALLKALKKS